MKTLTKFTAAAVLAIAAAAPAFAKDSKPIYHPHTMSQVQTRHRRLGVRAGGADRQQPGRLPAGY